MKGVVANRPFGGGDLGEAGATEIPKGLVFLL